MSETWTGAEKKAFAKDWENGLSVDALAEKYKRTPAAIKRVRVRFGLESRHMAESQMIRARIPGDLYEQLRLLAKSRKTSLSVVVRKALEREVSPI